MKILGKTLLVLACLGSFSLVLNSCGNQEQEEEKTTGYKVTTNAGENTTIHIINNGIEYIEGDSITFRVDVLDGYLLDDVSVATSSGKDVECSPLVSIANGYSFLMPAEDVTITTTASEITIDTIISNLSNKKLEIDVNKHTQYGNLNGSEGYDQYYLDSDINIFLGETSYSILEVDGEDPSIIYNEGSIYKDEVTGAAVYKSINLNNELVVEDIYSEATIPFDSLFFNPFNILTSDNFVEGEEGYTLTNVSDTNKSLIYSIISHYVYDADANFVFNIVDRYTLGFTYVGEVVESSSGYYTTQDTYKGTISFTYREDSDVVPYSEESYHEGIEKAFEELDSASGYTYNMTRTIDYSDETNAVVRITPNALHYDSYFDSFLEKDTGFAVFNDNNWYLYQIQDGVPVTEGQNLGSADDYTYTPIMHGFSSLLFRATGEENIYRINNQSLATSIVYNLVDAVEYSNLSENSMLVDYLEIEVVDNHLKSFKYEISATSGGQTSSYLMQVEITNVNSTTIDYDFLFSTAEPSWFSKCIGTFKGTDRNDGTEYTVVITSSSNITLNGNAVTNISFSTTDYYAVINFSYNDGNYKFQISYENQIIDLEQTSYLHLPDSSFINMTYQA